MISIIDYGLGNLGSIKNMFKWIGVDSEIISSVSEIQKAKKILLPGVGSFDRAMKNINDMGIRPVLDNKAKIEKIPVLGICLGMQLLTDGSEEGKLDGLSWISGKTKRFQFSDKKVKVPHMGWNTVDIIDSNQALTQNLGEEPRFYFVHSYYVKVNEYENKLLETLYGGLVFDSAIQNENIFGAQFHPEKSHKFGMQLLKNFAEI